jgi:hypothetical protein
MISHCGKGQVHVEGQSASLKRRLPDCRLTSPWDYFTFVRHSGVVDHFPQANLSVRISTGMRQLLTSIAADRRRYAVCRSAEIQGALRGLVGGHQHRSSFVLHEEHDEFRRFGLACVPPNDVHIIRASKKV